MYDCSNYDYLIFDCDGVILDSNLLKSRAFSDALTDEPPELVKSFVDYHKQHGGISRYEKFNYYFTDIQNCTDSEKKISKALTRFASIVKKGLMECNYVPGIHEFIKQQSTLGVPLFVVSGSDEKELKKIFLKRKILKFFKKIYGSPTNKIENTAKVIQDMSRQKKGCFFGDSKSDFEAAQRFGIDFVYVRQFSEWKDGSQISGNIIENFV